MHKAIFIDKDGTLIHDIPYNANPDLIRLEEGTEDIRQLQDMGYRLIVISNQSGVAHGYIKEKDLKQVEDKIRELLLAKDVVLDGFYYCPHHPFGQVKKYAIRCRCRKPDTGMFERACLEHEISATQSWMIGDILDDMEAGKKAGCRTILIDNGNETLWHPGPGRTPDFKAAGLHEAAGIILEHTRNHEH